MQDLQPLEEGQFYHIYNRGINGENLFKEERNYAYFLQQYAKYLEPVVQTFAYCLLPNHFHLLVRVKTLEERVLEKNPALPETLTGLEAPVRISRITASRAFSHFFNSYTQSINKAYGRTGGLFETPFKRKQIENSRYFTAVVAYIHQNPERHQLIHDFREYRHSSYQGLLTSQPTKLQRNQVMDWFGRKENFLRSHDQKQPFPNLLDFLIEFD